MSIAQDFGRRSTPSDEAWIESLWGHVKGENPHLIAITDAAVLAAELERVRRHYNSMRLHEGIGYVTADDEHEGRGDAIREAVSPLTSLRVTHPPNPPSPVKIRASLVHARFLHMTIYYFVPAWSKPAGGIRTAYRHVDILNAAGYDALILHDVTGFRCTWFENSTRVSWAAESYITPGDVVAVPEKGLTQLSTKLRGIQKVIFNQGPYITFEEAVSASRWSGSKALDIMAAYRQDPDLLFVMTVSSDGKEYLEYAFPDLTVQVVPNSIDPAIFKPDISRRSRTLSYMPRRKLDDAIQVLSILESRGSLCGWEVVAIEGLKQMDVARVMQKSACFMSLAGQEGFGLPAAEAMACGAVVVGYPGGGGREFFSTDWSVPIDSGDIAGFARAVEDVLSAFEKQSGEIDAMARRAAHEVAGRYSPDREREALLAAWRVVPDSMGQSRTQETRPLSSLAARKRRVREFMRRRFAPVAKRWLES